MMMHDDHALAQYLSTPYGISVATQSTCCPTPRRNPMSKPYVIAGVSGNTGKVVAESLLAARHPVRVLVRSAAKGDPWKAQGAEVAVADLGDSAALTRALEGAAGTYVLIPPTMTAPDYRAYQHRIADAITEGVEKSRVPHVVFLSSIGAEHPSGTGPIAALHRIEASLRRIPTTRSTFLRAGYFIENLAGSLGTIKDGFIPSFLPAALSIHMVGTVDIGRLAASLLVEGTPQASQVVELGSPATMNEVAAALSRIVGKPVRVQEAPLDAVVPTFTGFGMPKDLAELYREMIGAIASGVVAPEPGHRRVSGTTPVETVLRGLLGRT
jgi:uncharacterized protein YbjT (DUF2867 family)